MLKDFIVIGFGGALGSIARHGVTVLMSRTIGTYFPFGTLTANVAGCFLIGLLYGLIFKDLMGMGTARSFWIVGFCGGFTTFSSFAMDGLNLIKQNQWWLMGLYLTLSVFLGFLATFSALKLVQ